MKSSTEFCMAVSSALAEHKNEENRIPMEKYMKNQFPFYGIKAPEQKKILAPILKEFKDITEEERLKTAVQLFLQPMRECHYAALALLEKGIKKAPEESIATYKKLLMTKPWWDTVDRIAAHLCGGYFQRYPEKLRSYTEEWRASDHLWLRRSSLLHQLKYKGNTDVELLFETIGKLKQEHEFFIEKAIGWALREYSKTDAEAVIRFLNEIEVRPLSRREGLKWVRNKHPELLPS
ncbi:3-methyladenine DNA glycosylase AlkD [Halobacillus karajensis]|uniref:DNA alkylation repair protein n=1 Tax=Halobacillus karajensis TaxID=195088 RepID=UPI0008A7854A|nr:DNA alkylation repair protein [Halobacillus karajensis]SEH69499.1 3-methyladenine DNA glycosylase AlkD [Halobacillus karajensis]